MLPQGTGADYFITGEERNDFLKLLKRCQGRYHNIPGMSSRPKSICFAQSVILTGKISSCGELLQPRGGAADLLFCFMPAATPNIQIEDRDAPTCRPAFSETFHPPGHITKGGIEQARNAY